MLGPWPIPADRAGEIPLLRGRTPKPPLLSRRALRIACLAAVAGVVWGTLGPLRGGESRPARPGAGWRWVPPVVRSDADDLLANVAVYAPVGVALRLLVRRRGRPGHRDLALSVILAAGLSFTTELLQQAMPGRSSSLVDVGANAAGALSGALLAVPVQRGVRKTHALLFVMARSCWRFWGACVAAVCSWLGLRACWAGTFAGEWRTDPRVDWVPFRAHFAARFEASALDLGTHLLTYAAVVLFCLFATAGRARGLSLVLLVAVVALQEGVHAFLRPHAAGTTGLLLALVAWAIAVWGWNALVPSRRPTRNAW